MSEEFSTESANALADKVIDANVIPKRIPAVDDIDGQTKALGGALASALLTATEVPLHTLTPVIGALASQLVALGIRQTEHIDPQAVHAPGWIVDNARQRSVKLPDPPQHTDGEPYTARTSEAPPIPNRIRKRARAVRVDL